MNKRLFNTFNNYILIFLLFFSIITPLVVNAYSSVDDTDNLNVDLKDNYYSKIIYKKEASYDDSSVIDVEHNGIYAYVLTLYSGLITIAYPEHSTATTITSRLDFGNRYCCMYLYDSYLYVAATNRLYILDVSTPSTPIVVSEYDVSFEDVFIENDLAYMVGSSGLGILDVSDPLHPIMVYEYDSEFSGGNTIVVSDNYAYIGTDYNFEIFDVSDIENIINLDVSFGGFPNVYDIEISGDVAFLSTNDGALRTVDITDKTNPFLLDSYGSYGRSLALHENNAVIDNGGQGITVLDVTNASDLTLVENYVFESGVVLVYDISMVGGLAYVTGPFNGLEIINLINLPTIEHIKYLLTSTGLSYNLEISGDYAFVADGTGGLTILDISSPELISEVGRYCNESSELSKIAVNGTKVYTMALGSDPIEIIDISNLSNPHYITHFSDSTDHADLFISGDLIYLAYEDDGIKIFNASNTITPTEISHIKPGSEITTIYISEDYAFIGEIGNGLRIWDISDLSSPSEISYYSSGITINDIVVSNDYAYITSDDGFEILDISVPSSPTKVGNFSISCNEISLTNNFAHLTQGDRMITLNITDQTLPVLIGEYSVFGYTGFDVDVYGEYVFYLTDYKAIAVLKGYPDTDGDGLCDSDEISIYDTLPDDYDTDDDLLDDGEEVLTYFTDPNAQDSDGDGFTDFEEIEAGTDPNDPEDHPELSTTNPILLPWFISSIISLVTIVVFLHRKTT